MTTKLGVLALALVFTAPAMARTYKPQAVNAAGYKSVNLKTSPCCDRPIYSALISKKSGSSSFLIERSVNGPVAGFSQVKFGGRSFKPLAIKLKDYKATALQSGFVNPDLPRLTLLTAKDGSGKTYIERSGGNTANSEPMYSQVRY